MRLEGMLVKKSQRIITNKRMAELAAQLDLMTFFRVEDIKVMGFDHQFFWRLTGWKTFTTI